MTATAADDDPPLVPMIVGGRDATQVYPFMASMLHPHPTTGKTVSFCGASLVRSNYLLTAGHCASAFQVGVTKARVGSNNWTEGGTLTGVAEIIPHPGWQFEPGNDLALIRLDRHVKQKPIVISRSPGQVGDLHRIIGWGATCELNSAEWPCYPSGLQEADIRLVNDSRCSWYDKSVELCLAGDKGQMTCFGDSGGPDIREVHGRWQLVGATSRDGDADANVSPACGNGTGVYTDLTKYRSWIDRTTRSKDEFDLVG